jgi:glucose-1-phosphate cytidylyltransferase
MKVVLFCGGFGMRMRSGAESVPKPMMPIGSRPVLWHVMRYYAHFGHNEFILCLGYGAHAVKDYFLNYRETGSNDFVLTKGGEHIDMLGTDISNWSITFIDTGLNSAIGERLRRVRPYLEGDEVFLANYGDVLTDAPMNEIVDDFVDTDAVGCMLAVKPQDSFHVVNMVEGNRVTGLTAVADMSMRINGGYFVLRQGIFDYLNEGEDLVMDGCVRAARDDKLYAVPYDGFWAPMDTLKERTALEDQYHNGIRPWALWLDRPVDGPAERAPAGAAAGGAGGGLPPEIPLPRRSGEDR